MVEETTDKLRRKKPCPRCGSPVIDAKRQIIQMHDDGLDKMTVWAFCQQCGYKGRSVTARFISKEEAYDMAFSIWNSEQKNS